MDKTKGYLCQLLTIRYLNLLNPNENVKKPHSFLPATKKINQADFCVPFLVIYAIKQTEINGGVNNLEWDSNGSVGSFTVVPEAESKHSIFKDESKKKSEGKSVPNNIYYLEENSSEEETNGNNAKTKTNALKKSGGVVFCDSNSECSSYRRK